MKKLSKKPKVYDKTEPIEEKSSNENKKIAEELVLKVFPDQKGKKLKWKDIHNGYTNFSYLVTFEDGRKFQVRLPHDGKIINRFNEHDILFNYLKTAKFPYFDPKTGIAIKDWLDGCPPKRRVYRKHSFLNELFKKIQKLHSFELNKKHKFQTIKFDAYNENLYRLKFIYKKKFLCLIDRRRKDKLVMSHTDINPLNIIYDKTKKSITLIDYEWAGLASDYFDYANFIRETGLNYKKIDWSKYIENFSMEIFQHYLFMASVYSYLWTYIMPQSSKIIKYRSTTYKQIKKYYPCVVNVDTCITETEEKDEE